MVLTFALSRTAFSLSMDWYKKKTKDLIVSNIIIPYEAGNSAAPMNAGNVVNEGFELEASWRDNIGDFSYSVSGNIATLKNEVTTLIHTLVVDVLKEVLQWLPMVHSTVF